MTTFSNFGAFVMQNLQVNYYKFTLLFLLFLLLSFDQNLAMIYILIMFADWVWFRSDNFVSFPLRREGSNTLTIIIESLAGLGIFLVISTFLLSYLSPESLVATGVFGSAQSIFQLLSTTTPILAGNKILTFIGWAIIVPLIETTFFNGRLLEGFAAYAETIIKKKVSLEKVSVALIFIILIIAAIFTLFHLTAKEASQPALIITFIFSVISSILVLRHRETRGATFIHFGTNGAAVASLFGVI